MQINGLKSCAPVTMRKQTVHELRPRRLRDTIAVRGLEVRMQAGLDAWGRAIPQPVQIDAVLLTDVERAGRSDHLPYSINYGEIYRALEKHCREHQYDNPGKLALSLAEVCLACRAPWAEVSIRLPRALLRAEFVGLSVVRSDPSFASSTDLAALDHLELHALEVFGILGVNPWERETKQRLLISLTASLPNIRSQPVRYERLARNLEAFVETSAYQTVESLATAIARLALVDHGLEKVTVRVEKPSAIMYAECASVEVVRERAFFLQEDSSSQKLEHVQSANDPQWTSAVIAFGSNLGDRLAHIETALELLDAHEDVKIIDTSFLYETQPMYYTDQPRFLNGACRVLTRLSPNALLKFTQHIEKQVGRNKDHVPVNGPRVIDLDILLYGEQQIHDGDHLIVPHPRIAERAFALLPLTDLMPNVEHPVLQRSMQQLSNALWRRDAFESKDVARVLPLKRTQWRWGQRTLVMAILNATPDSFSDGGKFADEEAVVKHALEMVRQGADVLDIGGQSTAPNAVEVSAQEEIERVVPLIKALVQQEITIPISIDTYRASVARAALDAGATIVNDISGGERDPAMLPLIAERQCPYILMHMRGDASTMTSMTDYQGDVIGGVKHELEQRLVKALDAGVRRWNILLDPGIGFAKDTQGNLDLLRALPHIVGANGVRAGIDEPVEYSAATAFDPNQPFASLAHFPMLLGISRKRFLGKLTQKQHSAMQPPEARVHATMAACTAAIATKCVDMIRIHDVEAAIDTVRTADALVRAHQNEINTNH
ncbi:trifunctional dihydropteroate synthetase [Malassezia psittaci]|uniref:Folic acid synthesis protein FOL1 n=1 Tax=Malassezia psittaci TaxID=1821823 RepID=A0AAF0JFV6_9BASI|nr:trifunctional dihydropteroate synthetase [Malassezia psittaci]